MIHDEDEVEKTLFDVAALVELHIHTYIYTKNTIPNIQNRS